VSSSRTKPKVAQLLVALWEVVAQAFANHQA
jgi:hypothetical protein